MTPRTALAMLALTGLALAACGSDDSTTNSDAPTAEELPDRQFRSADVTGYDLVEGSTITIDFRDGSVSVNAGCNTMNGGFEITDGTFTAGPFASTMMACDDSLMEQDTWVSEFLAASPAIALDGSTLSLTSDDAALTFAEVQPAALVDTTWVVTGTVANQGVSSVPVEPAASLQFSDDGTVAIDTGCNSGSGDVDITETTLTFGPIATTRRACIDEVADLEANVLAVLQGEVAYEIDANTLSLRTGEGADEIGLELTARR